MYQEATTRLANSVVRRPATRRVANPDLQRVMDDLEIPSRASAMRKQTITDTEITPSLRVSSTKTTQARTRNIQPETGPGEQRPPAFYIGITIIGLLAAWLLSYFIVTSWTLNISDPAAYGKNRISVTFAAFGHNNDSAEQPTWIESFNYRGQAMIMEMPGGDYTKAKMYPGPHLDQIYGFTGNPRTAIITTQAADIDGDGRNDLVITAWSDHFNALMQRDSVQWRMFNTGKDFKPA